MAERGVERKVRRRAGLIPRLLLTGGILVGSGCGAAKAVGEIDNCNANLLLGKDLSSLRWFDGNDWPTNDPAEAEYGRLTTVEKGLLGLADRECNLWITAEDGSFISGYGEVRVEISERTGVVVGQSNDGSGGESFYILGFGWRGGWGPNGVNISGPLGGVTKGKDEHFKTFPAW